MLTSLLHVAIVLVLQTLGRRSDDVHDTLPRVDARHVTVEEFVAEFEMKRRPCIITHAMDGWPAAQRGGPRQWTWQKLRERFKDHKFKVGSDDDGCVLRVKTRYVFACEVY